MKTKIEVDDFLILAYWVKTFMLLEGKPFNHDVLINKVEKSNLPLDTKICSIDELMIDAYSIYSKLKLVKENLDLLDTFNIPNITKNDVVVESNKYQYIFDDLIENYKYEDAEIRGIQKGILMEKMNLCVQIEDYENAAKYRDIIKNI